jgi:hypothetical protein
LGLRAGGRAVARRRALVTAGRAAELAAATTTSQRPAGRAEDRPPDWGRCRLRPRISRRAGTACPLRAQPRRLGGELGSFHRGTQQVSSRNSEAGPEQAVGSRSRELTVWFLRAAVWRPFTIRCMLDPELLERITARRAELDELEEQLAKQLAEVRAERDELAVAERVLERVSEQFADERAFGRVGARAGGRPGCDADPAPRAGRGGEHAPAGLPAHPRRRSAGRRTGHAPAGRRDAGS